MTKKLFVGSLPYSIGNDELQALFGAIGAVQSIKVVMDATTGRSKGFAFVEMSSDDEANQAVEKLNGTAHGGRNIVVSIAKSTPGKGGKRPRAGGFSGGRNDRNARGPAGGLRGARSGSGQGGHGYRDNHAQGNGHSHSRRSSPPSFGDDIGNRDQDDDNRGNRVNYGNNAHNAQDRGNASGRYGNPYNNSERSTGGYPNTRNDRGGDRSFDNNRGQGQNRFGGPRDRGARSDSGGRSDGGFGGGRGGNGNKTDGRNRGGW